MSTAVAAVREHSDKYEKAFNTVVTFLTQYINKREPTLSVKVTSVAKLRPTNQEKSHGLMLTTQGQQLYELQCEVELFKGLRPQKAVRL